MLFVRLFFTFLKIGIFTFGGGYSMVALIQQEVVSRGWMTSQEFTDLLAVSQFTPGPIGINTATYAGYTAVVNEGYPQWLACLGALLASLAVVILPVALLMVVSAWIMKHKENEDVVRIFKLLRLVVLGLIGAAFLGLVNEENLGSFASLNLQLVVSLMLFGVTIFLLTKTKVSPLYLLFLGALVGWIVY